MRFDHPAQLVVAADTTQLDVRQPLPRRTLLFQIIKKTFRARYQRSVHAVRPQTHVDAIEIAFPRNTRESGVHQFHQTRISLVLRQRFDWRRNKRVVSDQDVEVRSVIDTTRSESSQTVKRNAWSTTERTVTTRHLAAGDEISDVHARRRQIGL